MNRKILTFGIGLFIVAIATAIAVLFLYLYEPKHPPKADDTGWTQKGVQEVVNANNQFAFDLYSELTKSETGNIFFSPYSISAALAMTYEGAKGQTADEIKSVFHFPENVTLRSNFAKIYNDINEASKAYELVTGNAIWVQQDYPLLEDYTSRIERYYGGKAANLDFAKEPEKSRQTINSFIEEQTNKKIKELLPPGSLKPLTRLVLTNAIYFKGRWLWEFNPKYTKEMDFYVTPSNIVKTPMMYMKPAKARFNYADTAKLQILELPYKGEDISMLILLPKQGEYYDFKTGTRYLDRTPMKLQEGDILLIDSLHGLYPPFSQAISEERKFKLYLEPLLQIKTSEGNYVHWTDLRLIRRMLRDSVHRAYNPQKTLEHWHYVRSSEKRNIIPYNMYADYIFNTGMPYELPLYAARLLDNFAQWEKKYKGDPLREDAYKRAKRIHKVLKEVTPIEDDSSVPSDSVLREFIGGSSLKYH